MKKLSICLFLLFLCAAIASTQTPEQRYFEWTSMPFSKEELKERRQKLIASLRKQGKKGLAIFPSRDGFSYGETFRQLDDFYYFTGLEFPNSLLVLNLEDASATIYAPLRDLRFESGSRPNDFPGRPLVGDAEINSKAGIVVLDRALFSALLEGKQKVFVNSGRLGPIVSAPDDYIATFSPEQVMMEAIQAKHLSVEFENIFGTIASLRMIKSPAEIEIMRKAAAITVEGIKAAAKTVRPGVDERSLEGTMEGEFKLQGSQRLAFGSIIKSGPNSLWPWRILATHYDRRNRKMEGGEMVIFDVGCEYQNYVSDIGRTFPVSGKYTARQKDILLMETKVADEIIAFLKPGITFNDIKVFTDSIIPEVAKKYMQVGLFFGHHLGLSTGDPALSNATLQAGMIFTVEPWYYNHDEEISVFTEDMILITEKGSEVLSGNLPRTPEDLEHLMIRD